MSRHADTIPRLRRYLDMTLLEPTRMDYLDALDALLAENQRLRDALKHIAYYAQDVPSGVAKTAREALDRERK